jgi:hypothetical protein
MKIDSETIKNGAIVATLVAIVTTIFFVTPNLVAENFSTDDKIVNLALGALQTFLSAWAGTFISITGIVVYKTPSEAGRCTPIPGMRAYIACLTA